jgi:hypothetical protein
MFFAIDFVAARKTSKPAMESLALKVSNIEIGGPVV